MGALQWFRRLMKKVLVAETHRPRSRQRKLGMEWLEDRIQPSYTLTTLANFPGLPDGQSSFSGVIEDSAGNLFGTTNQGGSSGYGSIYEWVKSTGNLVTLASFTNSNGLGPTASLIEDSDGNLYGTTEYGGKNNDGTVFEWVKSTGTITDLATFSGANGDQPVGGLIQDSNGNLFGTTTQGGNYTNSPLGDGTVFEWVKSTGSLVTLASFNGTTNGENPDDSLIEDANGNLFGTTNGWQNTHPQDGSVFEWVKSTGNIVTLASFNGTNGENVVAGLVEDSSGNLFGTAENGGTKGYGTLFEWVASTGELQTLANFNYNAANPGSGIWPVSNLIEDRNGDLFGTTNYQVSSSGQYGTVFEWVETSQSFLNLATFNDTDGAYPDGNLFQDSSGDLFDTTESGGENGWGTVFELSPNGDSILTNPNSETVNAGQSTSFTAESSNAMDNVQWQVNQNNGKGFTNINGANGLTLTLNGVTGAENGYEYQAVFYNATLNQSITSNAATLTVDSVTTNPNNTYMMQGQTATFTADSSNPAGTDTVQWQVNENDGYGFVNINGATSNTLTINGVTGAENGYEYQAVFSDPSYSGTLTSGEATLNVDYLTTNTSNSVLEQGQTATFTADSAVNADTVQWQLNTNNGSGFTNINGANSTTLTINGVTGAENGYEYQAVFSDPAYTGQLTSAVAALEVDYVTTSPTDSFTMLGQTATFTAATSNPLGTDTIQWQVNENNNLGFTNIVGATTTSLTLNNAAVGENGYEYRAVIANPTYAGLFTTSSATLHVDSVGSNPTNTTVNAGQSVTFTAGSTNPQGSDSVQWQLNANDGNGFINISGANGTSLTIDNVTPADNGDEYRAVFTNAGQSGSLTTTDATLGVDYAPNISTSPSTSTVNAGSNATFTAAAGGNPSPTVQWEVSSDGGNTFSAIGDGGLYSGTNTDTLTVIDPTSALTGYEYQAVFNNTLLGAGSPSLATTSAATLIVDSAVSVGTNPTSSIIVAGGNASFTASAAGNPNPTTQWQVSINGGKTYSNITDGGVYSGSTTGTLNITGASASMSGYEYRADFSNTLVGANSPSTVASTPAQLTVADPAISTLSVSALSIQAGGSDTVSLEMVDINGKNIADGNLGVSFALASQSGGQGNFSAVDYMGNGIYEATFTGTIAGNNSIVATVGGTTITSRLPSLVISPGAFSLANSLVTVSQSNIQFGGVTTITFVPIDAFGNPDATVNQTITFSTDGKSLGKFSTVTENKNGTYTATFVGNTDGSGTLVTTIGDESITSSEPSVAVSGDAFSAAKSHVSVTPAALPSATSTTVTLQVEDAKGIDETAGGLAVSFKLASSKGGQGTFTSLTDNGNGTYSAQFTGTIAGSNTIEAIVAGQIVGSSSSNVTVTPGQASPAKSTVAITSSKLKAGTATTLVFQPRDAAGNKLLDNGLVVAFGLGSSTSGAQGNFSAVKYNANGTYSATFTAIKAGANTFTVTVGGQSLTSALPAISVSPSSVSLSNSPVTVLSSTVAAGKTTTVELQAMDAYGNDEATGGLVVGFRLAYLTGGKGALSLVNYVGNGRYIATFTGTVAGQNTFAANIDGYKVTSSMPTITVTPGAASLAKSLVTLSATTVNAGQPITITLQAKDVYGNNETTGGLTVEFVLGNGSSIAATDNGNGTYTATYTSFTASANSIEAFINGAKVTSAPAKFKVKIPV